MSWRETGRESTPLPCGCCSIVFILWRCVSCGKRACSSADKPGPSPCVCEART